ncbi:MAG: amidohydrolase family protein [Candidatus Bathyarchaeota archaeon]|nr:amidohydrolase family protein [Candidatus Bathyarchaeota archaeon]
MVNNKIVYGKMLLVGSGEQRNVIRDGAVYIEDGFIRDVGEHKEISRSYSCDALLGSEEHIVMPGLVNSHHHGRGISQLQMGIRDAPLEVWISYHVGKTYDIDVYYNTLLANLRLIESGVTTSLHHFYGHDPAELSEYEKELDRVVQAHIDSGMRVALAPSIQDQNQYVYMHEEDFISQLPKQITNKLPIKKPGDEEISKRVINYFKAFRKIHDKYQNYDGRIKLLLGPTGVQWCSDGLLQRIKRDAKRFGVGIHMHLQETRYQRDYGLRVYGKSPLQHLADLNFVGSEVSFAHCVWVTEEDIDILVDADAAVIHNPSSNLRLFNGIAPITSMIEKGANVAMGIDGTGINDDEDMFQEMRLCSLIHRSPGMANYQRYSETLDSSKILDMATEKGAKTTGFGGKIGAIRVGAYADLILVNMRRIPYLESQAVPLDDILVGWAKGTDVDTVIINGEIIMKDHKFTRMDKEKIFNILKESVKEADVETIEKMEEYKSYIKRYYETWDGD